MSTGRDRLPVERSRATPQRIMAPASAVAIRRVGLGALTGPAVLTLQRLVGNRTVGRLLSAGSPPPARRLARKGLTDPINPLEEAQKLIPPKLTFGALALLDPYGGRINPQTKLPDGRQGYGFTETADGPYESAPISIRLGTTARLTVWVRTEVKTPLKGTSFIDVRVNWIVAATKRGDVTIKPEAGPAEGTSDLRGGIVTSPTCWLERFAELRRHNQGHGRRAAAASASAQAVADASQRLEGQVRAQRQGHLKRRAQLARAVVGHLELRFQHVPTPSSG
jgi:hypothetical protein